MMREYRQSAISVTRAVLVAGAILAAAPAEAAQNRWVPLNGPAQGGLVRSLLVQSGGSYTGTTLIASNYWGGVFRSTDGGSSWSAINSGLTDLRVRGLRAPGGVSASTLFANTWGSGIWRTDNAHAATPTWTRIGAATLPCGFIRNMQFSGSADLFTIYASGCGSVFKSTDSGATWATLNGDSNGLPPGVEASAIRIGGAAVDFGAETVWLATTGSGIRRSTDGGATWVAANGSEGTMLGGSSPPNGLDVFNVVGRTGGGGALYAYVSGAGVFKTTDGGGNWTALNTGLPAGAIGRALSGLDSIETSSATSELYLSIDGEGMYKLPHDESGWVRIATVDQVPGARNIRPESFVTPLGATWYAYGYTGIYKSTDDRTTWAAVNTGLPLGNVNNTSSHASTPDTVYAAGAFLYKSTDGGASWSRLSGLPHLTIDGDVVVDPNDALTVYAGTNHAGFWKSEDGGTTWAQMIPTGGGSDVTDGSQARVLAWPSATAGQTVLYAYFRSYNGMLNRGFYRGTTSDGGANISWSSINAPSIQSLSKRFVRHAADTDGTIYASTSAGLYVSTDTGLTWTAPPSWAAFQTGRIEIDPADPLKLYLAVYATDDLDRPLPYSGVVASGDRGTSWWQLASNEKMNAIRLAGSGPTAPIFGASAGGPGGNLAGAGRCLQWQAAMPSEHVRCQDMPALEGVLINHFETGSDSGFVVRRASSTNGVYKYIYNPLGQDFDGDGAGDVFWRNDIQNYFWSMNALAVADHGSVAGVSTSFHVAATGDFNGDGHTDLLWRHNTDGRNYVWLMNGRTRMSETQLPTVPSSFALVGAGDFNGDGKTDLLWRNTAVGSNYLWIMNGASRSETPLPPVPVAFSVAGVTDFDGDGKADILWRNGTDGRNYIWLMNGPVRLSETQIPTVPTSFAVAGVADTNGDGKGDIVWRNAGTGETYLWLMNGTARTETFIGTVASPWNIAAFGDYNGDGMSDILWRNGTTGQDYIWLMNGTTHGVLGGIGTGDGYIPTVDPASGWGIINK